MLEAANYGTANNVELKAGVERIESAGPLAARGVVVRIPVCCRCFGPIPNGRIIALAQSLIKGCPKLCPTMASVLCRIPSKAKVIQQTLLLSSTPSRLASHAVAAAGHGHHDIHDGHSSEPAYRYAIGTREVVGYGWAGDEVYGDSIVWPYPAIRFRRPESVDASLLKKEKGDWKNLSIQEKKDLYRYSFCETFSEQLAPTGQWKSIWGIMMFWTALALWGFMGIKAVYPPLPATFTDEHRLRMLKEMIDMRVGAVDGLASQWDYEKGQWKE
ncbi:putative Cytochrome c oxidase subunit 4 isoform 2, mitochondrial [Hypsibius exemplaris]|uniref:Cytochrome c oxidase subunit 4 n=1 Tax=Hypsibius exemplaris TaxID=2072580 RepID=A0A1W0X800_HYPEX|nr:putative Cytochrome c oxidase subunit 4 isoform 2, mitochondrial [Hypsibius exemplaris]